MKTIKYLNYQISKLLKDKPILIVTEESSKNTNGDIVNVINNVVFEKVYYKGEYNIMGLLKIGDDRYKLRVLCIVYNSNKEIFLGIDPKTDLGWFIGGSAEIKKGQPIPTDILKYLKDIASHETEEEAGFSSKNYINTNIVKYFQYENKENESVPKLLNDAGKIDMNLTKKYMAGSCSVIFVGQYDKPYVGKIAERDKSTHFSENGKWYKYKDIKKYLKPEEIKAIKMFIH
jgi:hypothetical protein